MGIALASFSGFYPSAVSGAIICLCRFPLNDVVALHVSFSCCFGCFVEFVFTIIFSFLCCNMWNNLAVNDLEVFAVAFSSDDLLALFQFDACRLSLLARQVRLYICCCSSLRNQHHWDDWIGCCQQSSFIFGDLAPIQLRSRPTQPFFCIGWVVAAPRAQPYRSSEGSYRSSMDSPYFLLDWIAMEIFLVALQPKSFGPDVECRVLCAECCVHYIPTCFNGSSLHLLEGCA